MEIKIRKGKRKTIAGVRNEDKKEMMALNLRLR
jgi:hypothetical protein